MPDPTPLSPFALTPPRIMLLVLGVLAVILIAGSILGGVANYQILHEAASASAPAASSAP